MDGKTPQHAVDMFWKSFHTKAPGKATAVIPNRKRRRGKKAAEAPAPTGTQSAEASYEAAAATCRAKVAKIVQDCRRVNRKYRDPHFNIEFDLKLNQRECLESLSNAVPPEDESEPAPPAPGAQFLPRSAKRVTEIFTRPQFYINGPTANDVKQGNDGDCWLMAALSALSFKEGLIERLCVAHDQDVGVYGFVFYRDGEWISEIVDDFLYLTKADYDDQQKDRIAFDELDYRNPQEAYKRIFQSNSNSLYFAQCEHPQETWLPLLEKCYAKAHGDYAALEGGLSGEGIEDLTGGVASEFFATDILDKDEFWKQLLLANKEFLFGCSTGIFGSGFGSQKGIIEGHAYSVQRVVEMDGKRLVMLRNPWGKGEWKGAWADGSKEWTPEWMKKLGHKFGEDGEFWICYADLLRHYQCFERVRLFGAAWNVSQIWTTLHVPWVQEYNETYFCFSTTHAGPVVIVVSQLDERYFRGLEGQYSFQLSFRVHRAGHAGYIVRSETAHRMRRSANVELDPLEAGAYEVYVKIKAWRDDDVLPVQATIRRWAKTKRDKVSRIGRAYDLAHSRGQTVETEQEKAAREGYEKRRREKKRAAVKSELRKKLGDEYYQKKKDFERSRARAAKKKERRRVQREEKTRVRKERRAAAKEVAKEVPEMRAEAEQSPSQDDTFELSGVKGTADKDEAEQVGDELRTQDTKDEVVRESKEQAKKETKDATQEPNNNSPESKEDEDSGSSDSNSSDSDSSDSDTDSLASFSDYSDRELDLRVDALARADPALLASSDSDSDSDSDNGLLAKDPWNAVAVVGLRVYHQTATVTLGVVRPNPYAADDDSDAEDDKARVRVLDVDDSAVDASLPGGDVREKKDVIMGVKRTAA
ncbi:calpain-like protein [Cordyceps militaris CM01]|uniref:Calpain-like protein n=1 Tax=Cordyceps militaris (strain CM01) TaxID=983644 RepID=G3JFS8_CORMM|nr:calpain-like protein [Cordyceps militaris CM01]EGX92311.1 calpain-like protein [Cordyceps militaris CM01]